ncbi:hypothetical protein SprV_0301148800 [Sparganum proliferum]
MRHEKSGANYWHLLRDDPNKTFGVQFRTTPKNSSGVSHILEHTALCGSAKYPVRDPFFKMLRRSQATFMNAMTASDWTMYPFSTMNDVDFHNLLAVYADAAFFPKLERLDFMQEGWRLEPEDLDKPQSGLVLKGVVYNEMKGVFSNSLNLFGQAVENNLMPVTYGNVSGGHPDQIPSLTWESLRQFHQDYYHPSNASIFTYGNVQLEDSLAYLDSECLGKFAAKDPPPSVPVEPRWNAPRTIRLTCQDDHTAPDPTRTCFASVSFALCDILDVYTNFALSIVCTLLMDGDNAPLYRGLIESGLGLDWAGTVAGMEKNSRTTSFHIGLQGVRKEDLDKVSTSCLDILSSVVKSGFPPERVEAVLHQYEIAVRQDSAQFGLNLILGLAPIVNHGGDIESCLSILKLIERFKSDLAAEPGFLQRLVREYMVENPHRLISIMQPDAKWESAQRKRDQERLEQLTAKMTPSDRDEVTTLATELAAKQKKEEDLSCLPCLNLIDIPPKCRPEPYTEALVLDRPMQLNEAPTNGLVYVHALADLRDLPGDLLLYVPIFADLFTRLGADGLSYLEMDHLQHLNTGAVCSSAHISAGLNEHLKDPCAMSVHISSFCLKERVPKMFDLLSRRFRATDWLDNARILTLVNMITAGDWSANSVSCDAHRFAMRRAASNLSSLGRVRELWSGLEQASLMRRLATRLGEESHSRAFDDFLDKMTRIGQHVLQKDKLKFSLHAEASSLAPAVESLQAFISGLPPSVDSPPSPPTDSTSPDPVGSLPVLAQNAYFALPYTVHYTSLALPAPLFVSADFPAYQVLAQLLNSKFLHRRVREQGGAYGGGATVNPGEFAFYSYRDPNAQTTLDVFEESLDFALTTTFAEQDVVEAKLSVFQQLDCPVSAGSRGLRAFLTGITDEVRQEHRERLFPLTGEAIHSVAEQLKARLSAGKDAVDSAGRAVLGPKESPDWKPSSPKDWSVVDLSLQQN